MTPYKGNVAERRPRKAFRATARNAARHAGWATGGIMTTRTRRRIRARHLALAAAIPVGLMATMNASGAILAPIANTANALAGRKLFVNLASPAKKQADAWRKSRPADAELLSYIAAQPSARWITDWASDVRVAVSDIARDARDQGAVPVLVAYNIPHRDCGSYSAGGASDASRYHQWISDFAKGINGSHAVVVLEPDAVAGAGCLNAQQQSERFAMLRDAVGVLKDAGAFVYLDAGNSSWMSASVMADRLRQSGADRADGFALNVSNFFSTKDNVAFGNDLSKRLGGKHYIIDTSRNGNGGTSSKQWCNPAGQALGAAPTTNTGYPLVDAFMWIKVPGESDGTCNGGPAAGKWWPEYALGLAQRSAEATH
jgi:endoglucanase